MTDFLNKITNVPLNKCFKVNFAPVVFRILSRGWLMLAICIGPNGLIVFKLNSSTMNGDATDKIIIQISG